MALFFSCGLGWAEAFPGSEVTAAGCGEAAPSQACEHPRPAQAGQAGRWWDWVGGQTDRTGRRTGTQLLTVLFFCIVWKAGPNHSILLGAGSLKRKTYSYSSGWAW